ncbi:MAG: 50S ribosomal protein L17 [Candidatus Omnitrophota bacterium]
MRHQKKKGRLNRRTSVRKATLKCLANDLFKYQRIETTMAKAKVLRTFAEPLITLAKNNPDSVSARRKAFQKLCDKDMVKVLFDAIAPLYKDTPGGYTRVMALRTRKGDGAQVAIIELTKRTISDEKLLGTEKTKKDQKGLKKKSKTSKKTATETEQKEETKKTKGHSAPEIDIEEKEERSIEDVKKEKAKNEQKKVSKKGLLRRFQRKSMG